MSKLLTQAHPLNPETFSWVWKLFFSSKCASYRWWSKWKRKVSRLHKWSLDGTVTNWCRHFSYNTRKWVVSNCAFVFYNFTYKILSRINPHLDHLPMHTPRKFCSSSSPISRTETRTVSCSRFTSQNIEWFKVIRWTNLVTLEFASSTGLPRSPPSWSFACLPIMWSIIQ